MWLCVTFCTVQFYTCRALYLSRDEDERHGVKIHVGLF